MSTNQSGQTLLEVIVVMAVGLLIVGALVFASIASIRNAQYSKNQAQATKLAQEVLEKVKTSRNRGLANTIRSLTLNSQPVSDWQDSDLWNNRIGDDPFNGACSAPCYFNLNFDSLCGCDFLNFLAAGGSIPNLAESINNGQFRRVVILSDEAGGSPPYYTVEKKVTAQVVWTDFSGSHESRLSTVLRKL